MRKRCCYCGGKTPLGQMAYRWRWYGLRTYFHPACRAEASR